MSDRDQTYLIHIIESIDRIQSYIGSDRTTFSQDKKSQDATIRNLQVLAESTQRLSFQIKAERPDVEWAAIAGFRNILVHEYLDVDIDSVWQAATVDLPKLKVAVAELLASHGWENENA